MSDTQGDRPADTTPDGAVPETPDVAAPAAPPAPPQTAAWQAAAWQAPGNGAPSAQGPAQAAPGQPQAAPLPSAAHANAPGAQAPAAPQQPYGAYGAPRPQGYAGQPTHPGAPQYASAFGPAAPQGSHPTQPTLPLGGAPTSAPTLTAPGEKKKSGAGKVAGLIVAAALVGGAAGLGGAYAGVTLFAPTVTSPASGPSTVTVNNDDSVNQTTAIAAKVVPSVVTISASSGSGGGTGSGVVLTEDGYVVTNTHVVTLDGATSDAVIRVTTSDGKVYDATIVGTDPTYDLAVIKLKDAEGLTPIEFADSSDLNVGDQTVAVGAPLGLSNTVTSGIVSALNRSIEIASSAAPEGDSEQEPQEQAPEGGQDSPFFFDFGQGQGQQQSAESIKIAVIQTDAAINPGNSGGALVDGDGKLIGINVAIASAGNSSGQAGSIGVGFAIPSNVVERITDEIIETGAATHGLLGAMVQDAANVEGSTFTGAYIAEATAGGAAAAGGLREGDVVTQFNGVPVTDATDLTAQVRAAAAGSKATVTYIRDGKSATTEVTLGELAP